MERWRFVKGRRVKPVFYAGIYRQRELLHLNIMLTASTFIIACFHVSVQRQARAFIKSLRDRFLRSEALTL